MKEISQRTVRISLILNVILFIVCLALLIYALLQKTMADASRIETTHNVEEAITQRNKADSAIQLLKEYEMKVIMYRDRADSAAAEAMRQYNRVKKLTEQAQ